MNECGNIKKYGLKVPNIVLWEQELEAKNRMQKWEKEMMEYYKEREREYTIEAIFESATFIGIIMGCAAFPIVLICGLYAIILLLL